MTGAASFRDPPRGRGPRLSELFPLPFVAVALLLLVLVFATPVLTGQSSGGVLSQAELIVDALPGNDSTHVYVRGLSTTARYSEINLGLAFDFQWSGSFPGGLLNWSSWTNVSSVLSVDRIAPGNPVAVNVTALYTVNGVNSLYVGLLALDVGIPSGSTTPTLTVASGSPGIGGFAIPVADLPVVIPLVYAGTGGTA